MPIASPRVAASLSAAAAALGTCAAMPAAVAIVAIRAYVAVRRTLPPKPRNAHAGHLSCTPTTYTASPHLGKLDASKNYYYDRRGPRPRRALHPLARPSPRRRGGLSPNRPPRRPTVRGRPRPHPRPRHFRRTPDRRQGDRPGRPHAHARPDRRSHPPLPPPRTALRRNADRRRIDAAADDRGSPGGEG